MAVRQNIDEVATKIVDSTLDTLRDQAENQVEEQIGGALMVDPSAFTATHLFATRKVVFPKRFTSAPRVTFGQMSPVVNSKKDLVTSQSSHFVPFLVEPHVVNFTYINGEVAGFVLGMYARTAPPTGWTSSLTISWNAAGKASRYSERSLNPSWTDSYNNSSTDFLVDQSTEIY